MTGPGRLLTFAIVASVFIGFAYGKMPTLAATQPFGALGQRNAANMSDEQNTAAGGGYLAAGACLLGAGIGVAASILTAGAAVPAALGFAALGCGVSTITFSSTMSILDGTNPLENVPVFGALSEFLGVFLPLIITYIS
ncbi:MAG: hypothetical protein ACREMA_17595, partial [Longimicrobiales bacterium]